MHASTWRRVAWFPMVALTLAIPAMAQVRPVGLSDSQAPGSVLVFPKFLAGTTAHGEPRSEFEIGITCPKAPEGGPGLCAEGTAGQAAGPLGLSGEPGSREQVHLRGDQLRPDEHGHRDDRDQPGQCRPLYPTGAHPPL